MSLTLLSPLLPGYAATYRTLIEPQATGMAADAPHGGDVRAARDAGEPNPL